MTIRFNTDTRNLIVDSLTSNLGYATLRVYSGSQPANAGSAPTGTLLVEIQLQGFNASANGSAGLATGTQAQGTASATGTAGWARLTDGTRNIDGSVGTTGTDFIINTTSIVSGGNVTLTNCTITQPAN